MKFLYGLTIFGSIVGGFILVIGVAVSDGAPQEAAAATIAVAVVVLPYCLARSAHEISSISARAEFQDQQRTQIRLLASITNELTKSGQSSPTSENHPPQA